MPLCPPQVVKVRLQVQGAKGLYRGPVHCALTILRQEGLSALFRGLPALLARDIPFNALFFGCYDMYCKALMAIPFPWREAAHKSDLSSAEIAIAVRAVCVCV